MPTRSSRLFLLLRDRLGGKKLLQGLRYALSCCAVWTVYLWEPLPHVAPLDRLTYPLADCAALLVMGLLLGALLGKSTQSPPIQTARIPLLPTFSITGCFMAGRLVQYLCFDIYSLFTEQLAPTLLWCLLTGFVVACAIAWCHRFAAGHSRLAHALLLGILLFGVDLALFNGFMPLVFALDLPDLLIRTFVDILFVTVGCLLFPPPPKSSPQDSKKMQPT